MYEIVITIRSLYKWNITNPGENSGGNVKSENKLAVLESPGILIDVLRLLHNPG